ncbi:MAG TPA: hypothetical protein VH253_13035 [Phycisphaerae bacterium]|nr:hypothetical protein [Phycisphaerae bacterium]
MKPEDLHRILDNPNLIEGVHNYCDRWCERCPFTRRCSVFLMEEAEGLTDHIDDPEAEPPGLEKSLGHVADMFAMTAQMIEEDITAAGGNFEEFVEEAKKAPPPRRRKKPPFIKAAQRYSVEALKWLREGREKVRARLLEMADEASCEEDVARAEALKDALAQIEWHVGLIYVKFARALGDELDDWDDPDVALARDRSAKVALLSVDASLASWETLGRDAPKLARQAERVVKRLREIREQAEACFPGARTCKRPGFDDPKYAELVKQFRQR